MKIKEVIVVEGKKDTARLKRYFEVDTFETAGKGMSGKDMQYLRRLQEERGLIVFTDPDAAGEEIRRRIMTEIPAAKQAFITSKEARAKNKVGVEHASLEILEKALSEVVTFQNIKNSLAYEDYYELGLSGNRDSGGRREFVSEHYHLGKSNSKTLWKRLNGLAISKEELKKVLDKYE